MKKATPKRRPAVRKAPASAAGGGGAARVLYVISDSTGNLARHMVSAYLTQFPPDALVVRHETFVRDRLRLEQVLARVTAEGAAVCHALVSRELKDAVVAACERANLGCHDLTGPGVGFVSRVAGLTPCPDLSALHPVDGAYRRRIDALEFTLAHDDGLGLDTLADADVVLTGVSRTSKSPTCILLAQQGYRAANVPLAPGVEPPAELLALPPGRVAALYIDPRQLIAIRQRRQSGWRMVINGYGDPSSVAEEVGWSRRLFARQGWASLDVTDQAVEESAAHVVEMLKLQPPRSDAPGRRCWDDLPDADRGASKGVIRHA